ncbi:hypothetical protein [Bradyrhizobium cosmicum]|uniref:Uncharacterized protein n=1 Tax=Bradyrhizobium cosmicum TaxID=1404864 RepID=A0AAI8QCN7_9BRAD|nr:hypothetical protein [Bradyrhizobium cosmicum]BAL76823.1 hypothetical protein S23_36240 [Bradyrhizobium cosmicum]
MRNIFDQYAQPENRVTHALMTALDEDRGLLGHFLHELVKVKAPVNPRKLSVLEQQYPGEQEPNEEELEQRGIPDGWICDDSGWCVFIEAKVMAKFVADQIRRHRRTAERRGFERITAVAITPRIPTSLPPDTVLLEWRNVYAWLRRHRSASPWAARAADYLEIAEAKLVDTQQFVEGTLTQFSGFPFGQEHPFTYLEGKRVLGLALGKLRGNRDLREVLGMNPKAPGRPAITGRRGDAVWDFLSLSSASKDENFTKYPHLTLGIVASAIEAVVTVPNSVNSRMRRNLVDLGEQGFEELVRDILAKMKPLLRRHEGATPWFRGVQRRYSSQRAVPFVDARIDFDLRTAVASSGPPKAQPRWLSAAYGAFADKKGTNYQIQMGVIFRYDRCPELRQEDAIDLIAGSWLACKPLVELAR